jgi:hypothetical protein
LLFFHYQSLVTEVARLQSRAKAHYTKICAKKQV